MGACGSSRSTAREGKNHKPPKQKYLDIKGPCVLEVLKNVTLLSETPLLPFVNLAFSGGGIKGYAFIGTIQALHDSGVLSRMRRVAGSSVGGICAGLVAIGCTPQEIADIFSVDNRWLFQDQSCTAFYCVPNIWKKFGVHPADRFYRIYGGHIQRKTGNADITFKELYDLTGRELCIVVTNLNKMCAEYCHPKTTPDLPVRLAVRMTMSFPVLYQPVECEINGVKSLYSDGGILDQFPIHVFDGGMLDMNHNTSTPADGMENFNDKTLGLYVIGETPLDYHIWKSLFGYEIPYHPTYVPNTKLTRKKLKSELDMKDNSKKLSPDEKQKAMAASVESVFAWPGVTRQVNINKFGDYLGATIETLLVQQRKLLVKPRDICRTVPVNAGYVGTNDYQLEPGDREFMIRQGYECVRKFVVGTLEGSKSINIVGNGYSNGTNTALRRRLMYQPVSIETQV